MNIYQVGRGDGKQTAKQQTTKAGNSSEKQDIARWTGFARTGFV